MQMDNINISPRFEPESFKNKEIARFIEVHPGTIIFKSNYKTEKELDNDWDIWNSMSYDEKYLANEKSMQLYGKKNEDLYYDLKKVFLKQDIDNKDIVDDRYTPDTFSLNTIDVNNSCPSNSTYAQNVIDTMSESTDLLECVLLNQTLQNIEDDSVVVKTIKEEGNKLLKKYLTEDDEIKYPFGASINSFYTPDEIKNIHGSLNDKKDIDWYKKFKARSYGLKSPNLNASEINVGWNPLLKYTSINRQKSSDRLNRIYGDQVFANYYFANFMNTPSYRVIEEEKHPSSNSGNEEKLPKGVVIYFIHGEYKNKEESVPRVMISFDPYSDEVIPIINGDISSYTMTLKDIVKQYEWSKFTVFFLPLDDDLYDKLVANVNYLKFRVSSVGKNFFRDVCADLNNPTPVIANDKLFFVFFVNSLIQLGRANQDDIDSLEIDDRILNLDGENKYSYILYKGDTKDFNRNKVFSKLKFFTDNKLNLSNSDDPLVEGYLHLHNTSLQVLNESTKNKKSKDYFNRVTFKEVADTLNKYKV